MKRHPSLAPFSRDHNVGLVLGRQLELGREGADVDFLKAWHEEMSDHFDEEEELLLKLCSPQSAERLLREHLEIRALVAGLESGDLGVTPELGRYLERHIRWEERELFVEIETSCSEAQLQELAVHTLELEKRRASSTAAPRRGELNQRQP